MTDNLGSTICILCGNPRIFSKKWTDKTNGKGTMITHEEYVCADKECQIKVDEKFTAIRERREFAEMKRKR